MEKVSPSGSADKTPLTASCSVCNFLSHITFRQRCGQSRTVANWLMETTIEYRQHAALALELAAKARDSERASLIDIAHKWLQLAAQREAELNLVSDEPAVRRETPFSDPKVASEMGRKGGSAPRKR